MSSQISSGTFILIRMYGYTRTTLAAHVYFQDDHFGHSAVQDHAREGAGQADVVLRGVLCQDQADLDFWTGPYVMRPVPGN